MASNLRRCLQVDYMITIQRQECIPVGCVPSAAVAVGEGVGVCPGDVPKGVHAGICLPTGGGVCPSAC